MKKQIMKKIILGATIFIFALFFLQFVSPLQTSAADQLNWDNPNANGRNPYKFKPTDVLNSQLIMQVVGCTGVVDKVSGAVMNFVTGNTKEKIQKKLKETIIEAAVKACGSGKKSALAGVAGILNMNWTDVVDEVDCKPLQRTSDGKTLDQLIESRISDEADKKREECFNGIAITLAKNQLTSMTRYTMNWINTGFNGNPMYVQNITSLTNSIEKNILESGINKLGGTDKAYPYGSDFSRSIIRSYNSGGIKYGATNFLDSLTSDLAYFVTDKDSYFSGNDDRTELQKSQDANNRFANDFSTGGWDGWLALTQRDQNNPLGFTMQASQYLADRIEEQSTETNNELLRNNGFLSQTNCVKWQAYDDDGKMKTRQTLDGKTVYIYTATKINKNDKCVDGEVVTPGSIIKDKLSTYINSPERQLELADTINESLNSLFSALISKFQNQGLASLASGKYEYTNGNMGISYGYTNDFEGGSFSSSSAGYQNGSFDLTRDLGNTYLHDYENKSFGTWNAKTNTPQLYVNLGPVNKKGESLGTGYYTVSVAGNTKLFNEGYNGWAVGDRAFWDGQNWQNWKCGPLLANGRCSIIQTNPIKKRGVVQIQKDYIVAAKEILANLPNIMPKLGELDYCIPGPNPNWRANSADTEALFQEFANTLGSDYKQGGFLSRDSTVYKIARPGDKEYDNYKNIFNGTHPSVWPAVTKNFSELYRLGQGSLANDGQEARHQQEMDALLNKINTDFQIFYDEFGKQMDRLYGKDSLMQKQYIEQENSTTLLPNPTWLPMAESGLNITKNILSYDESIKEQMAEYKDAIVQANSNIYKLEAIRIKVSEIIKKAQDRRDAHLLEILREETVKMCTQKSEECKKGIDVPAEVNEADWGEYCIAKYNLCIQNTMTEAEYKEKYKGCLEEEDILYYDDTDIMNGGGAERCNDGFDNDLDGLIDSLDPDCRGNTGGNTGGNGGVNLTGSCSINPNIPSSTAPVEMETDRCEIRETENDCTVEPYYHLRRVWICKWTSV